MPVTKVVVNLAGEPAYEVRVGPDLLGGLGQHLRKGTYTGERVLVLSDSKVAPLYLADVRQSLASAGYRAMDIVVPAGEASKSVACVAEIWEAMARAAFPRDGLVVALGGGVVGDIAGFVASTYMRGLAVVQVPTSLLAMVDSSVGGKTGINLATGKNLVGTFMQPLHVCASTDTLVTLPAAEWACGCAEVAKSAVIDSDDFFFWLVDSAPRLAQHDEAAALEAITRSVVFKAGVVAQDTREGRGIRECLNYGHTFGHAVEACAGFGRFTHGQAVAEGMRFAARLGAALLDTPRDFVSAQDDLLETLGLGVLGWSERPEVLLEAMRGDKKVRQGALRFVLPRDVGNWELVEVDEATLLEHLAAWEKSAR
ncbi:MAG: 3-dehydroquinate synthase [Eggerthellaceae bacterium]|jgi:3-dehydroquinate synthase|nr:3-dehydroquinate synthase [Eggerthellaceae bacterium]MDR2715559.1 3-dehydroquinate synthase [Coriobacteriaceae bacterium]